MSDSADAPAVVFRAVKKRKYRQKQTNDNHDSTPQPQAEAPSVGPVVKREDSEEDSKALHQLQAPQKPSEDDESSLSEALRRRNAHKNKLKAGVAFRADATSSKDEKQAQKDVKSDEGDEGEEEGVVGGIIPINKRFAPQTGIIGELVNKHMEEYIESRLAKRHPSLPHDTAMTDANATTTEPAHADGSGGEPSANDDDSFNMLPHKPPPMRSSIRGRIMEVDLGAEVREKNLALTEEAMRRLAAADGDVSMTDEHNRPTKVKLGKDGKPYRAKNRRDSDDIERDRIVEELMRENRLDVYDPSTLAPAQTGGNPEAAADDRIAEQFRREFMDAMSQRRRRRAAIRSANATRNAANNKGREEPILRGPKLGGSRNARAAMRDKLLEQQIEQQKQNPNLAPPPKRRK
ncbi:hypothetical protein MKZ38_004800 [Zalerion maritima]|uniref:Uncharacterized protein n=1 Tax=Zalerion maritima TaxID=339359 RepID=A0AAD5WRD6_9PEZI|nr:hypothetical protein MKZ38_004800 [Zalerion maritima]